MRWSAYILKEGNVAAHTIRSDAGYYILRCTENDRPTGRFIAFHVGARGGRFVLGGYDSSEAAKSACEHHAARQEVA